MLTRQEVDARTRFGRRRAALLSEAASRAHRAVYHDGDRGDALQAAWRLAEHELDRARAVGDHLDRLVALLDPGLLAVRSAALAFARTPAASTEAAFFGALRAHFRRGGSRFAAAGQRS